MTTSFPPNEKAFPILMASELGSAAALPPPPPPPPNHHDYSRSPRTLNSTASLMLLFVLPPRAWRPFCPLRLPPGHSLCFPSQIDWTANRPAWIIHTLPGDKPISAPAKSRKKRSDRHASDETKEDVVDVYSPNKERVCEGRTNEEGEQRGTRTRMWRLWEVS